jgi:TolA-binding protein
LNRGKALEGLGDTREAARAFLASFTGDSEGAVAPEALFELGAALGRLGQTDQACITLSEVGVRFPASGQATSAVQEMASLGCS